MSSRQIHLKTVVLAYASLLVLGLGDNVRGPLYPDILKEFSLTQSLGSLYFSVASSLSCLSGFFAHYLMRWRGGVRTLQASIFIFMLSQFLVADSSSYTALLVASALFGFSMGIMQVSQNVLVIESVPASQVQKWQMGLHSMYGVASLLAPISASALYGLTGNWRSGFVLCGIVGLAVFLAGLYLGRSPRTQVLDPSHDSLQPGAKKREMLFFSLILALYVALELMVSTRVALFVRQILGQSFDQGSLYTALFFVFLLGGRLLFVFKSMEMPIRFQLSASLVLSMLLIAIGIWVHPLGFSLSGLAMAPFYPLAMTAAGKLFPRNLSSVTSLAIGLSGVTVVSMHSLVGSFSDAWSLTWALLVGPIFGILALLMIVMYPKFFHRTLP